MTKILITGSAGFVGSHLVEHVLANTDWHIVGLDSFRHRGDSVRVKDEWRKTGRYEVFACDLSCPLSDRVLAQMGPVDYIINMASESHVDRSITDPVPFVQNNVNLALYMLEAARKIQPQAFVQISTDEVYGPALEGTDHKEWSEILPSNPYSASKAAQEAIAISYWRTFGVPLVLTNTMNMIGERQDREKYIPMVISRVLAGKTVTVHGSQTYIGKRHYLHARNHADALLFLLKRGAPHAYTDNDTVQRPDRWHIVGDIEMNNLTMAMAIADIIGKKLDYELVDFHALTTRPGHDRRYSLDGRKIAEAGWKAPVPFFESLERTVAWYLKNPEWLV